MTESLTGCNFCRAQEQEIRLLTLQRDVAVAAARWLYAHRGDWDGPAVDPAKRWPWIVHIDTEQRSLPVLGTVGEEGTITWKELP